MVTNLSLLRWTRDLLQLVDDRPYLEGALHETMECLIHAVPCQTAALILMDPETERMSPKIARGLSHRFSTAFNRPLGSGVISNALWERQTIVIDAEECPDESEAREVKLEHDYRFLVITPVISEGRAVGYLHVDRVEAAPFTSEEILFFEAIGLLSGLFLHRYGLLERVRDLEPEDPVTGVMRYPVFIDRLEREFQRSIAYDHPVGMLLIDVEGYGRLLDYSGTEAAREVLRRVGQTIQSEIRGVDMVGRYGPDEFIVALSDTSSDKIPPLAHAIRTTLAQIRAEPFSDGVKIAGGAICMSELEQRPNLDSILQTLRANLLRARRRGGNRIVLTCPEDDSSIEV